MFRYYNPNYKMRKGTIDCSVRAVSKALDVSWDEAYLMISTSGYNIGDVMSRNLVWWDVLNLLSLGKIFLSFLVQLLNPQ